MIRNFSILIGIVTRVDYLCAFSFHCLNRNCDDNKILNLFPWGQPTFSLGLIIFAVLTGLVNTTNTVASIRGFEPMVNATTSDNQYRRSFVFNRFQFNCFWSFRYGSVCTYISSIGFLQSTLIYQTLPMVIGAALFIVLGLVPALSQLFTTLPVSVRKCSIICCLFTAI